MNEYSWERDERLARERAERQQGMVKVEVLWDDYKHLTSEGKAFVLFCLPFIVAAWVGVMWLLAYSCYELVYFLTHGYLR